MGWRLNYPLESTLYASGVELPFEGSGRGVQTIQIATAECQGRLIKVIAFISSTVLVYVSTSSLCPSFAGQ
ncbi:hypothetical protein SAMN05216237_2727 [Pseudomonas yamanorum]|nr:hypothetical protein SAMN05216237_2727 [Pseudomonas yamanorum]